MGQEEAVEAVARGAAVDRKRAPAVRCQLDKERA